MGEQPPSIPSTIQIRLLFTPSHPPPITEKKQARRQWQTYSYPSLTNKLKSLLYTYSSETFQSRTSLLTTKDNSLWRTTKRILSYKPISSSLLKADNTWLQTEEETDQCFASHLQSIFTPNSRNDDSFHTSIIQDLNVSLPLSPAPNPVSPSDISSIIYSIPQKEKKASGYDLITSEILKRLPEKAIQLLIHIYNSVLRTTHFLTLWKYSIVKMIHKPSKPTHLSSSYRPIILLPLLGKVLEKLLLHRLYLIIDSLKVIPDHQFGFRALHNPTMPPCGRYHSLHP
jgi:hypothetical protein